MILGIALWGLVFSGILMCFKLFNTIFTIIATILIIISIISFIVAFVVKYIFKKRNFLTKSYFNDIKAKGYSLTKIFFLKFLKGFLTVVIIGSIINIAFCIILIKLTDFNLINNKKFDIYIDVNNISVVENKQNDKKYDITCRVVNDKKNSQGYIGVMYVGGADTVENAKREINHWAFHEYNEEYDPLNINTLFTEEKVDLNYKEFVDIYYEIEKLSIYPYIWFATEIDSFLVNEEDSNLENNYAVIENPYYY